MSDIQASTKKAIQVAKKHHGLLTTVGLWLLTVLVPPAGWFGHSVHVAHKAHTVHTHRHVLLRLLKVLLVVVLLVAVFTFIMLAVNVYFISRML